MEPILYYPGFEIQDERWLKFALLYLEKVHTIVPNEGDEHLSDLYKKIESETGMLEKYRPEFEEVEKSSNDAIEKLEKYLQKPERHFGILGNINVDEIWKDRNNQTYELFSSKFSFYFENFCKQREYAHYSNNGVRIPYQLGLIYMSILALNIGTNKNVSVITDVEHHKSLKSVNEQNWKYNRRFEQVRQLKRLIELNLPRNIDNISFDDIIKFRKRESYQKKLKSFRQAVSRIDQLPRRGFDHDDINDIFSQINEARTSITSDLAFLALSLIPIGFGIYLSGADNLEFIKGAFGGAPLAFGFSQSSRADADVRLAKKYITEIKNFDRRRLRRR